MIFRLAFFVCPEIRTYQLYARKGSMSSHKYPDFIPVYPQVIHINMLLILFRFSICGGKWRKVGDNASYHKAFVMSNPKTSYLVRFIYQTSYHMC
jgi:hypothetical protein